MSPSRELRVSSAQHKKTRRRGSKQSQVEQLKVSEKRETISVLIYIYYYYLLFICGGTAQTLKSGAFGLSGPPHVARPRGSPPLRMTLERWRLKFARVQSEQVSSPGGQVGDCRRELLVGLILRVSHIPLCVPASPALPPSLLRSSHGNHINHSCMHDGDVLMESWLFTLLHVSD